MSELSSLGFVHLASHTSARLVRGEDSLAFGGSGKPTSSDLFATAAHFAGCLPPESSSLPMPILANRRDRPRPRTCSVAVAHSQDPAVTSQDLNVSYPTHVAVGQCTAHYPNAVSDCHPKGPLLLNALRIVEGLKHSCGDPACGLGVSD